MTVQQYIDALGNPTQALRNHLHSGEFRPLRRDDGGFVYCLSHHLEARVESGGKKYLLALPLNQQAEEHSSRIATRLKGFPHLPCSPCALLIEGLLYNDSRGETHRAPLFVEEVPRGELLSEILPMGCHAPSLLAALQQLEHTFAQHNVAHNNLKPENLLLSEEGRFIALRPHFMTFEGSSKSDDKAFRALEALIRTYNLPEAEPLNPYSPAPTERKYVAVGPMRDERILICQDGLYGYLDCTGEVVIEPRFLWADDFREGRAEVELHNGFGLIDKMGKFIVEARYDGIDYDDMQGTIRVRVGEEWALLDYGGKLL